MPTTKLLLSGLNWALLKFDVEFAKSVAYNLLARLVALNKKTSLLEPTTAKYEVSGE